MGIIKPTRSVEATASSTFVSSRFCYRIGTLSILLEPNLKAEVLAAHSVYPLPFAPDWCGGLVSLRGDLFPVMDMHKIVLGKLAPPQIQLLLIQPPQFPPVILTCDGLPYQLKLSDDELIEREGENLPSWIPHTLLHNGQTLLAADHGRLLRQIQRSAGK
jgi:hypothetical protein